MLMSVSVIGVMAIQYLWLTYAIKLKSEEFERSVNSALMAVATDIEKKHTIGCLANKLESDSVLQLNFKNNGNENFFEFIMDAEADVKKEANIEESNTVKIQINRLDPDHNGFIKRTVSICTNGDSKTERWVINKSLDASNFAEPAPPPTPPDPPIAPVKLAGPSLPGRVLEVDELEQGVESLEQERLIISNKNKRIRFLNIVNDIADEYALSRENWNQFADSLEIRESINREFERRNLPQNFRFAVYNTADDTLLFDKNEAWENDITTSPYKAAMLPLDIVNDNSFLLVDFPQKSSYILWSLSGLLFLSLLFTFVIIASFAYSLYVIITQKKLGEITNDFINNMTHELKTPLATISMTADTLNIADVQEDKERISEYAGMIKGEAKRLAKQVDRILGAALWDKTGSSSASVESLNIVGVTRDVAASFETLIAQKEGKIELNSSHEQLFVMANRDILAVVISNLIDNSIKYTPEKPNIKIDIRQGGLNIVLSIKDNGIGISRRDKEMIFEKFYRVPQGNRHDVKGYGLGLSFVKTAIEERGGKVWVESEQGRGATFFITLPLA